ncbi:protein CYTOKININ-RESPONSIVE GATA TRANSCRIPTION FACTOR 1-like [Oryza brachyantha]|nr:protein CYTOKININ-RESPONSIVE GATA TRANSCRIPTION FACTOR 1-like [Oryza brachyantha]
MSTIYMSQLPATLPLMEGDQDQGLFPAFHRAKDPPILFPFMIDSAVEHQGQSYGDQSLRRQQVLGESNQQFNDHVMMGGSDVFLTPSPFRPTIQSIGSDMIQRSSYDLYDVENKHAGGGSSSKWMSTPPVKMRIIRKGAATDPEGGAAVRKPRRRAQAHQDESQLQQQQAMGVVRVCSDCNTTKTPLWRSGPCGPKSLCNACGIRQRKARRAMAAAANGGAAAPPPAKSAVASGAAVNKPAKKEKRTDVDRSLPFKKRCKMVVDHAVVTATAAKAATASIDAAAPKNDPDHVVGGGEENDAAAVAESPATKAAGATGAPPAFFHGLPRDEITDAAMLLMTLSCGLVRS